MQQREQRRIEEEIKQLRKLQGNKKCADCKSLSNPYVCSDYNTFVCTRCAGIHRELGHRVKSVTAEIFTKEEVAALKRYGNAKHNAIYLATWRESDFPEPAADDNKRIHKWFDEKYIRRRWYRDPSSASSNDNNYNNAAAAESYQQQPPPQQLQQQQQQQQQFQQQPQQQPQQMNNQGGWGSAPAWGAPVANQQPVQQNNTFNPFPGANMNAPANNTVSVNASFNPNTWGATTASVNNNNAFQTQRPQQPAQQSSADMLGLFMGTTTTTTSAPAPAPVNNGFGGFGTTTTTTTTNNNNANNMNMGMGMNMGMNMGMGMGMGMNTQPVQQPQPQPQPQLQPQPAFQSNVGLTTTMNPNRAQPLSRGQSNNPFASLVDIAPAVPSSSAPTSTNSVMGGGMTMTATTSSSAGNNNALDSLFSSAPQGQSAPAPVAQRTNNLIDF